MNHLQGMGTSSGSTWPSMVSNMVPLPEFSPLPDLKAEYNSEERRYEGTVKCFYGEKHTGHGFIFCQELFNRTGQDVYLHARQAHRCEVGDEVTFTVIFNSRKEPQARSVVTKRDEGKFLSKKKEQAERQATALMRKRSQVEPPPKAIAGEVMTEEQARKFQRSLKRG